jgi:hypothetical protein
VGCGTQIGAEIGQESKTQDPLGLLISLIPGHHSVQVSLDGRNHQSRPESCTRDMPVQPHGSQIIPHCLLPGVKVGTREDWDVVNTVVGRHCCLRRFLKEIFISSLSVTVMDYLGDQSSCPSDRFLCFVWCT